MVRKRPKWCTWPKKCIQSSYLTKLGHSRTSGQDTVGAGEFWGVLNDLLRASGTHLGLDLTCFVIRHLSSVVRPPPSVLCLQSSVVRHPPSVVRHPSSAVRRPSSVICCPPSAVPHPSSVIHHLSFLVCHPSSIALNPSSIICQPSSVVCHL